jgi:hypothetical protein
MSTDLEYEQSLLELIEEKMGVYELRVPVKLPSGLLEQARKDLRKLRASAPKGQPCKVPFLGEALQDLVSSYEGEMRGLERDSGREGRFGLLSAERQAIVNFLLWFSYKHLEDVYGGGRKLTYKLLREE